MFLMVPLELWNLLHNPDPYQGTRDTLSLASPPIVNLGKWHNSRHIEDD
jgi:hypothetical protein